MSSIKGYVKVDELGEPILSSFTLSDMSFQVGWEYYEVECGSYSSPDPNSTTTNSSTTTTWTTPPPTTTSTSTTSTSTSSTTSTSTTSTSTSSTSTTSTSTTSTTSTSTTSTSTTSTTTSSTTTTTTTAPPSFDGTLAVDWGGDVNMVGTRITQVDVNAQSFPLVPNLEDGDTQGEVIIIDTSYIIKIYVDTTLSANPSYVAAKIKIKIADNVGGTVIDSSPVGFTGSGVIQFTTSLLDVHYPYIIASV